MSGARKPIIFISYSHKDEPEKPGRSETQWLTFVVGFLRAAFPNDGATIWLDRLMPGGADWNAEIERKLRECDVFVLLVSRHSLTSEYVVKKEIAVIRERQKAGASVHFYPILLTPTPKAALNVVSDKNIRPRDAKPLSGFEPHEQERHMNEAAEEIAELAANSPKGRPLGDLTYRNFIDIDALRDRLTNENRDVSRAIAVRAVLRALPLYRVTPYHEAEYDQWVLGLFQLCVSTFIVARFGKRSFTTNIQVAPDTLGNEVVSAIMSSHRTGYEVQAGKAAIEAADAVNHARLAMATADRQRRDLEKVVPLRDAFSRIAHDAYMRAVELDFRTIQDGGASNLIRAPLWPKGAPDEILDSWSEMCGLLPVDAQWGLWIEWYERRLKGISKSEEFESAFVGVPEDIWGQGPKVVNAYIREHLDRLVEVPSPDTAPVPDVVSPYAYGWTAQAKIAAIAGPQNFPIFSDFTSPADHRAALSATRSSMLELLRSLRQFLDALGKDRRNVNFESYPPIVRKYLSQLPKAAGEGDILNAHQQALRLRRMVELESAELPAAILSGLESALRCHGALASFYDIVRRHEAAIPGEDWAKPFPGFAVADARKTVRALTPRYFEAEVPRGLRYVEATAPPEAPPLSTAQARSVPPPEPPLPEAPDERRSYEKLVAGGYNALYAAFREGESRVPDPADWEKAVRALGAAVEPLLKWLEATKDQKRG